MQLCDRAVLVGSGRLGLSLTDAYDCNVYLLDGGSELALVDTGAGRRPDLLVGALEAAGFDPGRIAKVLLTHKHADHAGGAAGLKRLTGALIYGSAETARVVADGARFTENLERAKRNGAYPGDYVFEGVVVDAEIAGGDRVVVGDLELRVYDTPGHCAGHCSFGYEVDGRRVLLTGDALLPLGQVVLQPIADCSASDSVASIEALAAERWDALLSGHLAPVLNDGAWHLDAAMSQVRRGRLPNSLYIPDA